MTFLSKSIVLLLGVTVLIVLVNNASADTRQNTGGRGRSPTRTTTTPKPEMSFHYTFMSPICVIKKVADLNNVKWTYTFVGKEGPFYDKKFRYALDLGQEHYEATSITKKSAEELVSEKALNETKYRKPPKSAEEDCTYSKSAVELVHELAQKYKFNVTYDAHELDVGKYMARCTVEMMDSVIITDGRGHSKRQAKTEAAERMYKRMETVNMESFRQRLSNNTGYNATDVTYMHPVSRLYEIQKQKHSQPPIFQLRSSIPVANGNFGMKMFTMEAAVEGLSKVGTGRTIRDAKKNAAKALLMAMGLPVGN